MRTWAFSLARSLVGNGSNVAAEGDYATILAGNYPRREDDADASVSEEVKAAARAYQESWNRSSDPFVGVVRNAAEAAAGAGERLFSRFGHRDDS